MIIDYNEFIYMKIIIIINNFESLHRYSYSVGCKFMLILLLPCLIELLWCENSIKHRYLFHI